MPKQLLVIQEYGIGNVILSTPLIRVLAKHHNIDVVVSSTRVNPLVLDGVFADIPGGTQRRILTDLVPKEVRYDLVLYCHPAGGIRANPSQVQAAKTIKTDPRKAASTYPFRFNKHEVEACMDMAAGLVPDKDLQETGVYCKRLPPARLGSEKQVVTVIGIGYLKDHPFWSKKHWGNENYISLIEEIVWRDEAAVPILIGDRRDLAADGHAIMEDSSARSMCGRGWTAVCSAIAGSDIYIGNDSGLMHVAAAYGLRTIGIFAKGVSNPVKNRPWCKHSWALENPSVPEVCAAYKQALATLDDK